MNEKIDSAEIVVEQEQVTREGSGDGSSGKFSAPKKERKPMNAKLKKGIDIGTVVLACIIFLIGITVLIMSITSRANEGVPKLFGYSFLDVKTESMQGTIDAGDMAIIKKVKSADDLKVGDIITFWDYNIIPGQKALNTHKIKEIKQTSDPKNPMYVTYGTNNPDVDVAERAYNDIVGEYSFRIPNGGHFVRFLKSVWGFLIFIVLPLSAFLAYRIYILVKVVRDMNKEKQDALDDDKEAMLAELAALRAKVNSLEDPKK